MLTPLNNQLIPINNPLPSFSGKEHRSTTLDWVKAEVTKAKEAQTNKIKKEQAAAKAKAAKEAKEAAAAAAAAEEEAAAAAAALAKKGGGCCVVQ